MQAVLLAAGQSSRFYPFTSFGHKSFVSVLGKTLLEHTIIGLQKSHIEEIIIVVSNKDEVLKKLGDLSRFSAKIVLVEQLEPLGMGDALLLAKQHVSDRFLLLHAHHVDIANFATDIMQKKTHEDELVLLTKEEQNVEKYGVIKHDGSLVSEIVEKPKKGEEPSNLRVVGIYLLSKKFLQTLSDMPTGHYNLESAISVFGKKEKVSYVVTDKPCVTLKHPHDLLGVNTYLLNQMKTSIAKSARVSKTAHIEGAVVIEDDVTIMEHATVKGPAYIGRGSVIGTNAIVRNSVSIGANCVIGAHMEVRGSVIMDATNTHSGFIGDSVIGRKCKIGAQFLTTNVRIDRSEVQVKTHKGDIKTGLKSLGVMIGDGVNIGGKTTTMPGVLIGNNAVIGPATTIMHNIEPDVTYYTKFHEVVVKHKK